ncbi:MAG TPA: hypothetical protein VFR70_03890, partial [Flavobacterium sp.]|nr:hypothetical protein [Flavobacterium sp.]
MKRIVTAAMALAGALAAAQNPEIKGDLPTVLPPSPSVAALMKFEEIPVDNYTGTPDISIPIFSVKTHAKSISLDIALKYHPASAAASEVASDAGLGWSLFAGGTVSRTVRDIPDEYFSGYSSGPGQKRGIYRNNQGIANPNPYYELIGNEGQISGDTEKWSEFLWNAQYKGKYDSQHDLWQYNFMGYSGRFVIKKNASGILEVVLQDLQTNLKIVNLYDAASYAPSGFVIYDDMGYKYVFDTAESTSSAASNTTVYQGSGGPENLGSSVSPTITYISSFHLTGIYDPNNNQVLGCNYNTDSEPMKEVSVMKSHTTATSVNISMEAIIQSFIAAGGAGMDGQNLKLMP